MPICKKTYTLTVAPPSLKAYYAFEGLNGSGRIPDLTDSNVQLFLIGFGHTFPAGKVGNAIRAGNDFISFNIGDLTVFETAAMGFTVCGWFKTDPDIFSSGNIWELDWSDIGFNSYVLLYMDIGKILFETAFFDVELPWPQDGEWHFYRAWYDAADSKLRLQIDLGTIVASGAFALLATDFNAWTWAGGWGLPGDPFYDETGYWNRVLTNAEAALLYNGGAGRAYPPPVL